MPPKQFKSDKLVLPEEVCERLGISKATFYRYAEKQTSKDPSNDIFPVFRMGHRYLVPRPAFEKWYEKRTAQLNEIVASA